MLLQNPTLTDNLQQPSQLLRETDLTGLWSIMDGRMPTEVRSQISLEDDGELQRNGNLAMFELRGPLSKRGVFSGSGSTQRFRRQLRIAAEDRTIEGGIVLIESPGGTAAGTSEAANELAIFNRKKPTLTFFEDVGGSASLWIGSQSTVVHANAPAWIGSIGTFMILYDLSGMFEDMKIRAIPITTGEFKGAGSMGVPITERQVEFFQGLVNQTNEFFIDAVARGRRIDVERVRAIADGRVFLADEAVSLGLIDAVSTLPESVEVFRQSLSQSREVFAMSSINNGQGTLANPVHAAGDGVHVLPQSGNHLQQALELARNLSPHAAAVQGGQPPAQQVQPQGQPQAQPNQTTAGSHAAGNPAQQSQAPGQAGEQPPTQPAQPAANAQPAGASYTAVEPAASIEQIEQLCQGSDPAFVLSMYKAGATPMQAVQAWAQQCQERATRAESAAASQQAQSTAVPQATLPPQHYPMADSYVPQVPVHQHQPVIAVPQQPQHQLPAVEQPVYPDPDATAAAPAGDAISMWRHVVNQEVKALEDRGVHRSIALRDGNSAANLKHPVLREQYVAEMNWRKQNGYPTD